MPSPTGFHVAYLAMLPNIPFPCYIHRPITKLPACQVAILFRRSKVNRTYGKRKNLYTSKYLPIFTKNIWSYSLWSAVISPCHLLLIEYTANSIFHIGCLPCCHTTKVPCCLSKHIASLRYFPLALLPCCLQTLFRTLSLSADVPPADPMYLQAWADAVSTFIVSFEGYMS